jgi:hypothetical protein
MPPAEPSVLPLQLAKLPRSGYWLIAANAIPLLGVLLWGWSTFAIVFIYWSENVVIGGLNLLKMFVCSPSPDSTGEHDARVGSDPPHTASAPSPAALSRTAQQATKLFLMPFFTVHYGLFCFVHGVFVFALLGDGGFLGQGRGGADPFNVWQSSWQALREQHLGWAVLGLAISHGVSFVTNFLAKGEYRRVTVPQLMAQPYGRVVVLHLAIVLGAFATIALGSPVLLLLILIVGKTALDLKLHLAEHAVSRGDA